MKIIVHTPKLGPSPEKNHEIELGSFPTMFTQAEVYDLKRALHRLTGLPGQAQVLWLGGQELEDKDPLPETAGEIILRLERKSFRVESDNYKASLFFDELPVVTQGKLVNYYSDNSRKVDRFRHCTQLTMGEDYYFCPDLAYANSSSPVKNLWEGGDLNIRVALLEAAMRYQPVQAESTGTYPVSPPYHYSHPVYVAPRRASASAAGSRISASDLQASTRELLDTVHEMRVMLASMLDEEPSTSAAQAPASAAQAAQTSVSVPRNSLNVAQASASISRVSSSAAQILASAPRASTSAASHSAAAAPQETVDHRIFQPVEPFSTTYRPRFAPGVIDKIPLTVEAGEVKEFCINMYKDCVFSALSQGAFVSLDQGMWLNGKTIRTGLREWVRRSLHDWACDRKSERLPLNLWEICRDPVEATQLVNSIVDAIETYCFAPAPSASFGLN